MEGGVHFVHLLALAPVVHARMKPKIMVVQGITRITMVKSRNSYGKKSCVPGPNHDVVFLILARGHNVLDNVADGGQFGFDLSFQATLSTHLRFFCF